MTALTIAVVLVGALCLLDLLLTFGVIRRLRENDASRTQGGSAQPGAPMAPVGTRVGDTGWEGETLVGFFAPGCSPCEQQLPGFIEHARARDRVVAVVHGMGGKTSELVRKLEQVADVVVEDSTEGPLHNAFKVEGFPSYCVVRDGVISSVAGRAADLVDQAARVPA